MNLFENLEIIKTSRKGSIGLKVEPNRIALMVPKSMTDETIALFIKTEKDWLLQKVIEQKQHLPKQMSFISGNELLLFGEKILYKEDHHTLVKKINYQFLDNTLIIFCKQKRELKDIETHVRKVAVSFFVEQLQNYITQTLEHWAKTIQVEPTQVSIKNYKSRWGSCYQDGRIQFNWRLAMAPKEVIDYVIVHELCHLIHPNHSKQYWQTVAKFKPNYEQQKQWLKNSGAGLMSL